MLQPLSAVWRASRVNNRKEEPVTSTHVDDGAQDGDIVVETYDDHETINDDDDDASTNVLESIQSSRHTISTGNFIMERDPSAENANNERNNLEEAINDSLPEIEPSPNIEPFESKCDADIEMQVFELQSSQPVPFVEAENVITPVPTTKDNQFTPAPSVETVELQSTQLVPFVETVELQSSQPVPFVETVELQSSQLVPFVETVELQSSQPVPFVEAEDVITPVQISSAEH